MTPIAIPYFIIAAVSSFFAKLVPNAEKDDFGELSSKRKSQSAKIGFIIVCIILISFSAFRLLHSPSNDEYAYRNRYDSYSSKSFSEVLKDNTEPLIATIFWLSTRMTSSNQGGLIFTSFITIILILLTLKRDAKNFSFSILMLLTTGYLFATFNGVAQFLAAAMACYSFKYVYKKNKLKFFISVIICCLIHSASIIFFLFYIICNTKLGSAKMFIWDLIFLGGAIAVYQLLPVIIPQFGILTDYFTVVTKGHHGVNILRILVAVAPAIIALMTQKQIPGEDRITVVAAHMTILNALIYIAGSMDVYIARFAIFTDIFVIIFLSRVLDYIKKPDNQIFKFATICLYSLLTLYTMQGTYYTFNFIW